MKKKLLITLLLACILSLVACTSPDLQIDAAPPALASSEGPTGQPSGSGAAEVEPGEGGSGAGSGSTGTYTIVDTGQSQCYDDYNAMGCPQEGAAFYGQDAQYAGNQPRYQDNGDGTVTDLITGLMWQQTPDTDGDGDLDENDKVTWDEAKAGAASLTLGGYTDWRLPTIKELYSLIDFSGLDPSGYEGGNTSGLVPFIDTAYFDFVYGDTSSGARIIDAQYWSSTGYVGSVFGGSQAVFGVNFADGRIKGYGLGSPDGREMTQFVRYVRGNPDYGQNEFVDNGDGTISDLATGLMWQQRDSGTAMDWSAALAYCENLDYAGYDDWRLPNVKELESIVDYSRSPDTTGSAALSPLFTISTITNEAGETDYPFFWSSTTHANLRSGDSAAYVAFGRALGYMQNTWMDVHGAGAQRSDPKTGDAADWPTGHGPQGDAIRIDNYARCVRDGATAGGVADAGGDEPIGQPPIDQQPPGGQLPGAGTPPQEAVNACAGLSQGASCNFSTPRGALNGTCQEVQSQLACAPLISTNLDRPNIAPSARSAGVLPGH